MSAPSEEAIRAALAKVDDPEIRKPLTELGMVKGVDVDEATGRVDVGIYLTVASCPMRDTITDRVRAAVSDVPGVGDVAVELDVMDDAQRTELRKQLRGDAAEPVIPFAQPGNLTRVYAVASGKGGVGKSTATVNLATALAARGLSVGVLDADIYGHSIPRMLGTDARPTQVEQMILPPVAHEVKVISIAQFTKGNTPVVWRGPMLHRALQQFLADVYWGDLDVLLMDLPPGTGDVAISIAQLIPNAEILVVTTPQAAAAEVAERAGAIALQTRQRIAGVIENMSWLELPDGTRMDVFGTGGGAEVAANLSRSVGATVPLLGQVPLEQAVPLAPVHVPEGNTEAAHHVGVEALAVEDARDLVERGGVRAGDDALHVHVAHEGDLLLHALRDLPVRAADDGVRLDAEAAQFRHRVLGGLGLELPRGVDVGHQGHVEEHHVGLPEVPAHLPGRLQERERLDISHGAPDLRDDHVRGCLPAALRRGGLGAHALLDLVHDVRDHLDGGAQVLPAPLACDHPGVDLPGGGVRGAGGLHVQAIQGLGGLGQFGFLE